jgi:hypothetical protein
MNTQIYPKTVDYCPWASYVVLMNIVGVEALQVLLRAVGDCNRNYQMPVSEFVAEIACELIESFEYFAYLDHSLSVNTVLKKRLILIF